MKKIEISDILYSLQIKELNQMQTIANETILKNKNTLLLSPTGSGKTLAFLLPILQLLNPEIKKVQVLILVPSRELGLQIEYVWKKMNTYYKVNMCYGGHNITTEINNLSNPPAVLIGTPGRILDHLTRNSFGIDEIEHLILDEFDKSLELGFHTEMSEIIFALKNLKRRVLVSATSSLEIPSFVGITHLKTLDYLPKFDEKTGLLTKLVLSKEKDKLGTLFQLICSLNSESALVFCNHREVCQRITHTLNEKGVVATYYHGGMDQEDRERALIKFRNGSISYLITTDLAARGLDIPEMKHVIHYQLPGKQDEFTHRNGRTARMKTSGTSYILHYENDFLPDYLQHSIPEFKLKEPFEIPQEPKFITLYISGGKKDKVNKIDIVGFFCQKGKLEKESIGMIEVKDFQSFVAIKRNDVTCLLKNIQNEKMKGKKYKIEIENKKITEVEK